MNAIQKVTAFHNRFKLPVIEKEAIPDHYRCKLRINLIKEEYYELILGVNNVDIVEVADALCDMKYVILGSFLEFGIDFSSSAISYRNNGNLETMQENVLELSKGIFQKNIGLVNHTLSKLLAGVNHIAYEYKLTPIFDELFNEVHRSNMTKGGLTQKKAMEVLTEYEVKKGILCDIDEVKGKYFVNRLSDGKLMKPDTYSPPELKAIFVKHRLL